MLTKEQIVENKNRFLELIGKISSDRVETGELVEYLFTTDFFTAPASVRYNCCYEGGLCEHTLNVYRNLKFLAGGYGEKYSEDELILTALLHDFSKIGFYEKYMKPTKQFIEEEEATGRSKFDSSTGKWFNWVDEVFYKVKDGNDSSASGTRWFSTLMILNKFMPVFDDEFKEVTIALVNQYDGTREMSGDIKVVLHEHPLTLLLHEADSLACYITDDRQ